MLQGHARAHGRHAYHHLCLSACSKTCLHEMGPKACTEVGRPPVTHCMIWSCVLIKPRICGHCVFEMCFAWCKRACQDCASARPLDDYWQEDVSLLAHKHSLAKQQLCDVTTCWVPQEIFL